MLFPSWPAQQVLALRHFIGSSIAVHSSLAMADEEMKTIRDLDIDIIQKCRHILWFYHAEQDDWVGEERKRLLGLLDSIVHPSRFVLAPAGVPHAFCISESRLSAYMHDVLMWMPFIKIIMKSWRTAVTIGY